MIAISLATLLLTRRGVDTWEELSKMKEPKDGDVYFFVDEVGDPVFFNAKGRLIVGQPGCSRHLMLGYIRIKHDPAEARNRISELRKDVLGNPEFQRFPSLLKHTAIAFHASTDAPPIRDLFFELIADLSFHAVFIVSRKYKRMFLKAHDGNTNKYYDSLVSLLFSQSLHSYSRNHICFASRGSRLRQKPLELAIERARQHFEAQQNCGPLENEVNVCAQSPKIEPCLSIVDYVGWAIQRAYTTGDRSFLERIQHKVGMVRELKGRSTRGKIFNRKRGFEIG